MSRKSLISLIMILRKLINADKHRDCDYHFFPQHGSLNNIRCDVNKRNNNQQGNCFRCDKVFFDLCLDMHDIHKLNFYDQSLCK